MKDKGYSARRILRRTALTLAACVIIFFVVDLIFPFKPNIEYSPVVEAKNGMILHAFLTKDGQWRMKARLDEITPELKKAIIFKEDKHFYHHPGVNLFAVCRAAFNNIFRFKRSSGASTITMQVARMLEPKRRTYINKVIEMFRALQLELYYNKEEILQMYLNIVPYGSNIEGVKAASVLYFNKTPDQLSLAEITTLSIIPNRPNSMVVGKDNGYIVQERNKWLNHFKTASLFDTSTINDALAESLIAYRHEAPKNIPQLALRLRKRYKNAPEIRSTIDADVQTNSENVVSNYMKALKLNNINNAAVLVVDNQTHQVLAYIGSADFKDIFHNGQVDGVCALRSPGSTLKPLLYGIAFDHGYITPRTIITDVPTSFNGYTPENYDLSFRGNVTAEDALRLSLNVPAVKLLDHLGTAALINAMGQTGFNSVWQRRKELGLSMVIGGCEVRLEDLTALFSTFANEGNYYPLALIIPDSVWMHGTKNSFKISQKGVPVISKEADFLVTNILRELHRPDLPNLGDQAYNVPKVAWKTGTSYGRKDAWSIGYNKRYTIGVWVGNFSGKGIAELGGAAMATPLMFQLFNAIDKKADEEWIRVPEGVAFRYVCATTGKLPNDYCSNLVMDYYIPGVSASEICDHMKTVWLSADEKFSYCTSCLPPNGYKIKNFPNLAPELVAWYDNNHIDYEKIPPHNSACTRILDGKAPIITSLNNEMTYIVTDKGKQQIQLSCNVSNDVGKVYWYINDKFIASTIAGGKTFFVPNSTRIKISCTDDKGRNSNIFIKVKFI